MSKAAEIQRLTNVTLIIQKKKPLLEGGGEAEQGL